MNAQTTEIIDEIPFYNALTRQVYSPKNAALLYEAAALAGIEGKAVAGFKQWLELGRVVKKGQHGTHIFMIVERRDDPNNADSEKRKVPKGAVVFFESQTKPIDGDEDTKPTQQPPAPILREISTPAPAPVPVREAVQVVNKAAALRKIADGMQAKIDHALSNRLENTPKRRREAASARTEGYRLQRTQKALRRLAELHDSGEVPAELAAVTTKAKVYELVATILDTRNCGYYDAPVDTGKPRHTTPDAVALWALLDTDDEALKQEALRREISKVRQADIPGFFPTPLTVINTMLDRAESAATFFDNFADFSAGDGAIADVIKQRYPDACLCLTEINATLCNILMSKGHAVTQKDFLTVEPNPVFDVVLINPPFENLADVDHVQHAYKFLRPGGVLVAVMSPGPFFRSSTKAIGFREWLEAVGGQAENLPEGSFKESGTGVNTKLVTISKGF